MRKRSNVFWKIIMYILVVIVLLGLIVLTNKPRESTIAETVFSYTLLPVQNGFNYFKNWVLGYKDVFPQIEDLKVKNEQLEAENNILKNQLMDYELLKSDNNILKQQMNLVNKYPEYSTLSAEIIAYDTNGWQEILVINQGSNDGLKPGMTVVADKGLVGYVKEVSPESAEVLCIIDAGNSVSGRVSKSRESIICRGELGLKEKSQMKLIYIPTDVELVVGDIVETSGLGGIYKKGIKIGEVKSIVATNNNLEDYAIISTSVDFSTLEYVIVIMD